VYGRDIAGKTRILEPSGGLIHGSLVLQDRESDTYWSIMTGEAIGGPLKGEHLQELPLGTKARWQDWVKQHPETVVLSVDGVEHIVRNPYDQYFESGEGFRGSRATDSRLATKSPIFAFRLAGHKYAAPHDRLKSGRTFDLGEIKIFLYREKGAPVFASTHAFYRKGETGFEKIDGVWVDTQTGAKFNSETGAFESEKGGPEPLTGIDTFWYNWSLNNPDTELLGK